jgi:outer membrane protein
VRLHASLRLDGGRRASDSADLAGMGDIRATVRGQVALRWRPMPEWQLGMATSLDVLDRVGGCVVNASAARTFVLAPGRRLTVGAGLGGASSRYLQAWYGVTPAQAAASGYARYTPRAGLREVGAHATYRIEIDPQWAAFAGGSVSRLLGPAADSPLTARPQAWGLTSGIARRF